MLLLLFQYINLWFFCFIVFRVSIGAFSKKSSTPPSLQLTIDEEPVALVRWIFQIVIGSLMSWVQLLSGALGFIPSMRESSFKSTFLQWAAFPPTTASTRNQSFIWADVWILQGTWNFGNLRVHFLELLIRFSICMNHPTRKFIKMSEFTSWRFLSLSVQQFWEVTQPSQDKCDFIGS